MAKRLFDKHKKKFLKENGFCKFDLKAKAILPLLEQIYKKNLLNQSEQAFYVTHNDGNVEKITHIHNEIVKVCEPFITDVFPDFEVFAAHFVVKKAHSKVSFQLHQDWSSVEEYVENSVQIWIPLSLSYPENGGMGFIPKSHLFFNNYRSGSYGIPHVEVVPKLYPYLSYLRLFPGEAAFFYNSTFHCSFINSTDEDRVAVLLNIAPKNMKKIYFHQDGNHVEKYEMDTVQLYERLHLLEKGELPHGLRLLERAPYEQPDNTSIDADLLIRKLTEMNHKQGLLPDYEVKLYDIIKDVEIAQEINDKGYAIIDFLTEKEREEMGEWFSQYSLDISKSQDAFAIKQTKEIHQKIQEVIQYRIEHFFKDAYSPYSYLYSNESKAKKHVDWQRDPSIILNEQLEPLYGIRCNLTNKGEEVRLKVVPGSHRLLKRLNFVPAVLESPLTEYLRVFDQYEVLISLKVGQALLYDMRLIHSTISNASEVDADYLFMQIAHRDIQDFFNVKIKEGEERKGLVFRLTNDCFFNENREGDIEGSMHFFDYPISESDIHEYLKRFVKK